MAQKRSYQTRRKSSRSKRRGGTLTGAKYLINSIIKAFQTCRRRGGNNNNCAQYASNEYGYAILNNKGNKVRKNA
jgi:hypothetical protein